MNVEISPEVRRGVEWLDNQTPQWTDYIDPMTIDMRDPGQDVLGRVYGDYGLIVDQKIRDFAWACAHGFNAKTGHAWSSRMKSLTEQWAQVVRERQVGNEAA